MVEPRLNRGECVATLSSVGEEYLDRLSPGSLRVRVVCPRAENS